VDVYNHGSQCAGFGHQTATPQRQKDIGEPGTRVLGRTQTAGNHHVVRAKIASH